MARAQNTRHAYRATVRAWCDKRGLNPLPAAGAAVLETMAGISREAARQGETPRKSQGGTRQVQTRVPCPLVRVRSVRSR